jgi:hypothetical protein
MPGKMNDGQGTAKYLSIQENLDSPPFLAEKTFMSR